MIKVIGYHATSIANAEKIEKKRLFVASTKGNEWLGAGVYFWAHEGDAIWWMEQLKKRKNKKYKENTILKCGLKSQEKYYRDFSLRVPEDYIVFCKKLDEYIKESTGEHPTFEDEAQARNFYCDLYKKEFNLRVLACAFNTVGKDSKFGFDDRRLQYCVSEGYQKECISIIGRRRDNSG